MTKKMKGLLLIAMTAILIGAMLLIFEKTSPPLKVSAHPEQEIVVDAGTAEAYKVAKDDTQLFEPGLISQSPNFDNFVQSNETVPIIKKGDISALASNLMDNGNGLWVHPNWSVLSVEETSEGDFFVVYNVTNNGVGGIARAELFKNNGEQKKNNFGQEVMNQQGQLLGTEYRVSLGVINRQEDNFLVYTSGKTYFNYSLRKIGAMGDAIGVTKLTSTQDPAVELRSHVVRNVDRYSTYSDDSWIAGTIYYGSLYTGTKDGIISGRVPVGTIDTSNWLTNNGFTGRTEHKFSVENVKPSEIGYAESDGFISPTIAMDHQNSIYGVFRHVSNATAGPLTKERSLFEVFDRENSIEDGKIIRKRRYTYDPGEDGNEIYMLKELSTLDEVYFLSTESRNTKLVRVNLNTFQGVVVKEFPRNTVLNMIKNPDGSITYYGTTENLDTNFYSSYYTNALQNSPYYFVQGIMTAANLANPFSVVSVRAFETENITNPAFIKKTTDADSLFVAGSTYDFTRFVYSDDLKVIANNGEITQPIDVGRGAFVGAMSIADDYAPAIYADGPMFLDITDQSLTSAEKNDFGWTPLDHWLITGSKKGSITNQLSVQAFDTTDMSDSTFGATVEEQKKNFLMRLNRNPLNFNGSIDWEKLGFDKTKIGPQRVTYFISDTQQQSSVTSRWVNSTTPQTVIEGDYALDVQNFHVPLKTVAKDIPNARSFKKYAKSTAWHTTGDMKVDEDVAENLYDDSKVTVDATQLKALQQADTDKPYPVDVTYEPSAGIKLTNRVWVFLTTKNTVPNGSAVTPEDTNGVVYYGDDYTLSLGEAKKHTEDLVLETGNVRVYDYYDTTHETDADLDPSTGTLPTLADAKKQRDRLSVTNLSDIMGAAGGEVVNPDVVYPWLEDSESIYHETVDETKTRGMTHGTLDITITGDILFHVRQVVYGDDAIFEKLVIPDNGYLRLNKDTSSERPIQITSGKENRNDPTEPKFKSFRVNVEDETQFTFDLILPEFYEATGYLAFDTNEVADSQKLIPGQYCYELSEEVYEKWITLYIKPKTNGTGSPQPYSWDHQENELGNIRVE